MRSFAGPGALLYAVAALGAGALDQHPPVLVYNVTTAAGNRTLGRPTAPKGSHSVLKKNGQHLGGMVSMGAASLQTGVVYYPSDLQGKYPLVAFAHGALSGGVTTDANYGRLLSHIASFGYVVVAMDVCAIACPSDLYAKDLLNIVDAVKKQASKNKVFALADTSKVALAGHSWGAIAAIIAATKNKKEVKAVYALHPCPCASANVPVPTTSGICGNMKINVPIGYFTGTADTVCSPPSVLSYYTRTSGPDKVYASINGVTHFIPYSSNPKGDYEGPYVGSFFRCWLDKDQAGCNAVYGSNSNSLCKEYSMYRCVNNHGSGPAPAPAPPGPSPSRRRRRRRSSWV